MSRTTIGPFTGTHLTIMSVALIAMMLPGTLWAVAAYTRVAIQDPFTGTLSAVDAGRRVQVYDPIANPLPASYVRFTTLFGGECVKVASPPAGKALIVKSLHLNTITLPGPATSRWIGFQISSAACDGPYVLAHNPATLGLMNIPLEPGITVLAGKSLWRIVVAADTSIEVYGFGYLVPAGWVPANPPVVAPVNTLAQRKQ